MEGDPEDVPVSGKGGAARQVSVDDARRRETRGEREPVRVSRLVNGSRRESLGIVVERHVDRRHAIRRFDVDGNDDVRGRSRVLELLADEAERARGEGRGRP